MFIKKVLKPNGNTSVLIVESHRKANGQSTHRTLRSLGSAKDASELEIILRSATEILSALKQLRQPVLSGINPIEFYTKQDTIKSEINVGKLREETRLITGSQEVFGGLYDQLGFSKILETEHKQADWNEVLKACVLSRMTNPVSKLKTSEQLVDYSGTNISSSRIYRMMDKVFENMARIKEFVLQNSLSLLENQIDVTFFDVTTLHFESFSEDDLRRFGFSKNCRFKETQVVLALQTARGGIPVGYELYPGNTYEGKTLIDAVKGHKERFKLRQVVLVADRAMFNEDNLKLMEELGVEYVVAAKLRGLKKDMKNTILSFAKEVDKRKVSLKEFAVESRRLIVSYSPDRAKKDASDRDRLVVRIRKQLGDENQIDAKKLIRNSGTTKYLKFNTGKTSATLNEEKIAADAGWDGLHGIITNTKSDASELLERYRGLWQIEEAFRINKTDLKMRPIYHWKKSRIEAHIAICYLAFALIVHIRTKLREAGINISVDKIKYQISRMQKSVLRDVQSGKRFVVPSQINPIQKGILNALGLKRSDQSYFI